MRVLSKSEQKVLTDYLISDIDIYKFGILLTLYTGIRIGELCALTWDDVTDDYILINKTMYKKVFVINDNIYKGLMSRVISSPVSFERRCSFAGGGPQAFEPAPRP